MQLGKKIVFSKSHTKLTPKGQLSVERTIENPGRFL